MVDMIRDLTPAQDALLSVYEARWARIGLTAGPMSWDKVAECVDCLYTAVDLPVPARIIAVDSPLALLEGAPGRWLRGKGRLPKRPPATIASLFYSQDTTGWLGFFIYMREVLGLVEETAALSQAFTDVPRVLGWCDFFDTCAVVAARPLALHLNAAGDMHNLDGPAIVYPDGFALYYVRGVSVPAEFVENRASLDPSLALTHPNVEQRAVLADLIGWDRVLDLVEATVVDANPNRYIGTLLEATINGMRRRFLRVACPTGRTMVLSVNPDIQTAQQANDSTYGDTSPEPEEGRT